MTRKKCFVFVVCGAKEHLDTLHFSLERLKKHSRAEIIVLTDSTRNEIKITHSQVIDVKTAEHFDHHQASIYLKTGIHKFLPVGPVYCYLDTDIIALKDDVDEIFNEYTTPIIFAPDHCKLKKFSPYSINCGCKEAWEQKRETFEKASLKYDKNRQIIDPASISKRKKLQIHFEYLKNNYPRKLLTAIRYLFSTKIFHLNKDFYFDKNMRVWKDSETNSNILFEVDVQKIESETKFTFNKWTQKWLDQHKQDIWKDECEHLSEYIEDTFGIHINNKNWQHWNGGVFLFDESSHDFLEAWHQKTLHIFKLDKWKTRDQGTLIATVWQFGLNNHKTLSKQWNFIADYNKSGLDFTSSGKFTDDHWQSQYQPSLLHVYHHWGDISWSVWNWVLKQGDD